jgi:hypothetical protein
MNAIISLANATKNHRLSNALIRASMKLDHLADRLDVLYLRFQLIYIPAARRCFRHLRPGAVAVLLARDKAAIVAAMVLPNL